MIGLLIQSVGQRDTLSKRKAIYDALADFDYEQAGKILTRDPKEYELLLPLMKELREGRDTAEPRGMHSHKCPDPNCAHIWSHDSRDIHSAEEGQWAHTCCKCGREQYFCY